MSYSFCSDDIEDKDKWMFVLFGVMSRRMREEKSNEVRLGEEWRMDYKVESKR